MALAARNLLSPRKPIRSPICSSRAITSSLQFAKSVSGTSRRNTDSSVLRTNACRTCRAARSAGRAVRPRCAVGIRHLYPARAGVFRQLIMRFEKLDLGGHTYTLVRGSDLHRDGVFLELEDSAVAGA